MPDLNISGDLQEGKIVVKEGDDVWGEYLMIGPVPEGEWQLPDSDGLCFPVLVEGERKIVQYEGGLPRGMAMFILHKSGFPLVELTDELKKFAEVFDRHESPEMDWMLEELGSEPTFGRDVVLTYEKVRKRIPSLTYRDFFRLAAEHHKKERQK